MKLKTKLSKLRHDGYITDAEYSIIINALNKKSKERVQQPCENCISRAEALRIAKSYYHAEYVVDKIRQLPPVTPWLGWIPVSERLPETDGVYSVTRRLFDNQIDTEPYYMVDACYFDGSNTWHDDNRINHERSYLTDIIAWMPRPQPYEVESEE